MSISMSTKSLLRHGVGVVVCQADVVVHKDVTCGVRVYPTDSRSDASGVPEYPGRVRLGMAP
eukprot:10215191-Alexandrium_andersonii.AAC.1